MELTYFGILRSATSWAKVCRELVSALIDLGGRVNVYERKGFLYDPGLALPQKIEERIDQRFCGDAVLTFEHPASYKYLQGRRKAGILTYESTVAPKKWIENINRFLDRLIVPSSFCRDVFARGGVRPDRIAVLPHGYNPAIYNPSIAPMTLETEKRFRFLSVASPHKREGIDRLLDAYERAFTCDDDVSLILKTNYIPQKKAKPFEQADLNRIIGDFQKREQHPDLILSSDFISEEQMARLYRSCHCLVSATRGEGFGMAFLEALACGVAVMATGWGGHLDFLNEENATLIEYHLTKAKEIQYDNQSTDAEIAEVDVDDLADKMRGLYESRLPLKAPEPGFLDHYTWENIAKQLLGILTSSCHPA